MHLLPAGIGILISYILILTMTGALMKNGNFQSDVFYGMSPLQMFINQL